MPISFSCPDCNAEYEVPDDQAGLPGQCECGTTFEIPQVPVSGETGEPGGSAAPGWSLGCLGCLGVVLMLAILVVVHPKFYLDVFIWLMDSLKSIFG